MYRRLIVDAVVIHLLGLFMLGLVLSGCSLQQNPAERPNWSLSGAGSGAGATGSLPAKAYGDWNGPGAPKPLMYENAADPAPSGH